MPAIPRVIHQTWKDADVPADMARLAATWRRQHPRWAYRFWDDAALRAFVAERRPALLAAFDGYARGICRVDLARYVIMAEIGGLYADLDFECLAPNDALLGTQALLIGLEPQSHLEVAAAHARGLTQLLSPAWIASVPGHPFWDPAADAALFAAITETVRMTSNRQLIRLPHHINDPTFAAALAQQFRALHQSRSRGASGRS